ncbi:MAG: dihydrofolate reductase family protein [Actinomycetota bacterium]|nr:dihydrofolate reductase family protein [Actinomycetota bacterium]
MRTLVVIEFVTLDGVMQGLGSADEDRDGGFEHGGWSAAYGTEVSERVNAERRAAQSRGDVAAATTAYLFGRRTYEKMAAYWPLQPDDNPMAAHLNASPKYVATRTLTDLSWPGAERLDGGLPDAVLALKASGEGSIAVLGSGVLVDQLVEHDLVDRYRLFVHPLLLGTGKRLFRGSPRPQPLTLVECTPTASGVIMLTYDRM